MNCHFLVFSLLFVLVNIWKVAVADLSYPNKEQNIFNTLLSLVKMNPLKNSKFYKKYSDNIRKQKSAFKSIGDNKLEVYNYVAHPLLDYNIKDVNEDEGKKEKVYIANYQTKKENQPTLDVKIKRDSNEFSALLNYNTDSDNQGNYDQDKSSSENAVRRSNINEDFEDLLISCAKRMKEFNISK